MKKVVVNSPKFGEHLILVDDDDYDKIKKYTWRINYHGVNVYAITTIYNPIGKNKDIKMHRLIMGFPNEHIDHRDNNGLNNQKYNLRLCTISQNTKNKGRINSKSGFKGVTLHKREQTYQVAIKSNGKTYYSCGHKNPIDAAKKYNELAIIHHGDFANLNIIPNE